MSRPIDDLQNATGLADILRHLARGLWAKEYNGAECPDNQIPTPADLAEWLPKCPATARAEADELVAALLGPGWCLATGDGTMAAARPLTEAERDTELAKAVFGADVHQAAVYNTLEQLHAAWCAIPDDAHPRHPLAPLVSAWQQRTTHREARTLVNRASLPRFAKVNTADARLPDFPEGGPPPPADGQLLLPGFDDTVRGCASWLLWLFDHAGGESLMSGRGAPWDLRLFVFALLHLDVADRDGEWHTIHLPTAPEHAARLYAATGKRLLSVEDWLHPKGWANKRRDWYRLPEALDRMRRLAYIPVPGIGRVAVLFPSVIPSNPSDPLIEWTIRIPRSAATGDRLNWPRLVAYGADSARLFRAYLAVAAWLGRSAKRGHPLTRQIAAPVNGPDGKPRRRKGGAIIRSATEQTSNPAARYAGPPLSDRDLARMIGFDPTDKRRRYDARTAFERMEADGVIEIDRSGGGFLIYGGANW